MPMYFTQLESIEKSTTEIDMGVNYLCSECDVNLFNEIHVIKWDANVKESESTSGSCDYMFIEPQKWMKDLFEVKEGDDITIKGLNMKIKNMDLIEDNLFLGNQMAANDVETLQSEEVKYVLSVWNSELNTKSESITYMKIDVQDYPGEHILSYFVEAIHFIRQAQDSGRNILVHCHMGYSRSATIVIAFLMRKYRKTYKEAEQLVRQRRIIGPNPGFVTQLKLFYDMNWTLNANDKKLRNCLLETILRSGHLWYGDWINQLARYFTQLETIEKSTTKIDMGVNYLCSECDAKLFNEIHVIKCGENDKQSESESTSGSCDYVFIEPQKWMKDLFGVKGEDITIDIKCPNCPEILVDYNIKFSPFPCDCPLHSHQELSKCLRFRIDRKKIKIES
ncbi:unnamed protein product [Oppiella nova]|uniref:protein-tyrosine-phosphatase n=1 Tax=Oppiella nova TaxID=334625 RepID=A0A7R9M8X7_9ACAR|nr:unnamed protein product [Oppiella nova]CAG2172981.1 unnamed protein product [Oppiella nova]